MHQAQWSKVTKYFKLSKLLKYRSYFQQGAFYHYFVLDYFIYKITVLL